MSTIKDIVVAVCLSLIVALVVSIPLEVLWEKAQIAFRKRRHPKWFEYYNFALKLAFDAGSAYNEAAKDIEQLNIEASRQLLNDEITAEVYLELMSGAAKRYVAICEDMKQKQDIVNDFLHKADDYARTNDLKWGRFFD